MEDPLLDRIKGIPKAELHLHLEGSVRPTTLLEIRKQRRLTTLGSNMGWRTDGYRFENLAHFVKTMATVLDACIQGPEDYERIAYELFLDLSDQNVRYAEVSFDLGRGIRLGIPLDEILSAISAARQRIAASHTIRIGLIVALNRYLDIDTLNRITQIAVDSKESGVVGIDLHGDESIKKPEEYAQAFDVARRAGLGLRAHAGEAEGASSVWETIRALGVSRIAHGIRSIEDGRLIRHLIDNRITLDVCPTSNYKLSIVPELAEHPIRRLFDLGVRVTVNSDDPLFFATTITNEYYVLARVLGFSLNELKKITLDAVESSFLTDEEKRILHREVGDGFPSHAPSPA